MSKSIQTFKSNSVKVFTVLALGATPMMNMQAQEKNQPSTEMTENTNFENPLLKKWNGPYGGVPAFNKMDLEQLKPAMEKAMELHLEQIQKIANNPEPATFENTIVAMESAGKPLDRVFTYYGIWSSNMSSPEFRDIQQVLAPEISEYSSKISQNEKLFQRIKAVYDKSQKEPLEADQAKSSSAYL